jgi:hypothetical protein
MCKELGDDPFFEEICDVCGGTGVKAKFRSTESERDQPFTVTTPQTSPEPDQLARMTTFQTSPERIQLPDMPPPQRSLTKRKSKSLELYTPASKRPALRMVIRIKGLNVDGNKEKTSPGPNRINDPKTAQNSSRQVLITPEKRRKKRKAVPIRLCSTEQSKTVNKNVAVNRVKAKVEDIENMEVCPNCDGVGFKPRICRWCDGSGSSCMAIGIEPLPCPQLDCEYREVRHL